MKTLQVTGLPGGTHLIQRLPLPGAPDPEAERIRRDAKRHLGLDTGRVMTSRLFIVQHDLAPDVLARFAEQALCDAVLHDHLLDAVALPAGFEGSVAVARMPGVTDDEGRSAETALADLADVRPGEVQAIFSQELIYLERALPDEDLERLATDLLGNSLINHFDWGPPATFKPFIPEVRIHADATTEQLSLAGTDEELLKLSKDRVLSLNREEMKVIRDWYRAPGRADARRALGLPDGPTDCELEVFAQTWSEHCKHKEFQALIEYTDRDTGETRVVDSLFKTFIRGSTETIKARYEAGGNDWLVKIFSDNAGVVRIDEDRVFVWKVETHNTPSALDPYGGAITGILGNNRDPLGTGRGGGRLLFNTNVLCFGPPDYSGRLLTGQLHPRRILEGVRHGIEDGGNKSGVPTVNGAIVFDERYSGKPLVYCGTGSIMPARYGDLNTWEKEVLPGDRIIMAGGRVGQDGIHGATFSSVEIDKNSPRTAVQVGSPITQKLLSDFMEDACAQGLIRCTTDNGAGGLASSVGELAPLAGGARVHLERVPLKYAGLKPWEIFVSESQERMTFIVDPEKLDALMALAAEYEVEATDIGEMNTVGRLDVLYGGRLVAALDLAFLHDGVPRKQLEAEWSAPALSPPDLPIDLDHEDCLLRLLGRFNICSRETVIRQYDHEVKGKTIINPLMGTKGRAPQDAAVMRLGFDGWQGVAVSNGILPRYGDLDAYQMSAGSFDEAVRQLVSVGARLPVPGRDGDNFWTVNDNFCVPDSVWDPEGNPDGRYKLAQLVRMCQALYDMSTFHNIPMTSGKDSMKNDFRRDGVKISVPPTLLYSMVAKVDDVRRTITAEFKAPGDLIYQLGETFDELGGSELLAMHDQLGDRVPTVRPEAARVLYEALNQAQDEDLVASCHDLSDGGLAVALAEAAFGGGLGAEVDVAALHGLDEVALYSESHSRFLVTVAPDDADRFEAVLGDRATLIGQVTPADRVVVRRGTEDLIDLALETLFNAWNRGLEI